MKAASLSIILNCGIALSIQQCRCVCWSCNEGAFGSVWFWLRWMHHEFLKWPPLFMPTVFILIHVDSFCHVFLMCLMMFYDVLWLFSGFVYCFCFIACFILTCLQNDVSQVRCRALLLLRGLGCRSRVGFSWAEEERANGGPTFVILRWPATV